jgi:hypothetical protein
MNHLNTMQLCSCRDRGGIPREMIRCTPYFDCRVLPAGRGGVPDGDLGSH